MRILGIVFIVAGVLALALGGFSYQKETPVAKLGPLEVSRHETHTVDIPMAAGIGAIVAGVALVALGSRRR